MLTVFGINFHLLPTTIKNENKFFGFVTLLLLLSNLNIMKEDAFSFPIGHVSICLMSNTDSNLKFNQKLT